MRVNIEGLINRLDSLRERIDDLFDKLEELGDSEQEEMTIEDVEDYFQNDDTFNLSIALDVLEQADKLGKTFEIIKECCEFDFIKKEENDKPIRYEIHIRRKGGDSIFFPCLAIYPKNQQEFDLLKEVLLCQQ